MCGICGYIGGKQASDVLLEGLKKLEYRGYDSCGVAVSRDGGLAIRRVSGRVELLAKDMSAKAARGNLGIAHTRWATHGIPSEENAHPHTDCRNEIVIVHNGIIENHTDIKKKLERSGHKFKSETDSEIIVHLLEQKIKGQLARKGEASLCEPMFFEAFKKTVSEIEGSFALAAVWAKCPFMIMGAKMHSPLVVGLGKGENFIASDVSAFLKFTKNAVFLDDGEIVALKDGAADYFDFAGRKIVKAPTLIKWDSSMSEKGGYSHFMLKEIHEQPESVENTLRGRVLPLGENVLEKETGLSAGIIKNSDRIQIIACGTAYHAAMVCKYVFENFQMPAFADLASEFSDRAKIIDEKTLVIAISQSGETADTLYAVDEARRAGAKILAVTNTVGSSLARKADFTLFTHCGPEIGVASTKAFLGQLAAIYALALHFAIFRGKLLYADAGRYVDELIKIPRLIDEILADKEHIKKVADDCAAREHFLFIARHINYPVAMEGALKLKEISYLHAEGYAAGEMKHGPIAIISEGMPVLAVATSSKVVNLVSGNIEEARSRGAEVIAIVDRESRKSIKASKYIAVPETLELFSPALNVIPLQLFAFYAALNRGCDIDKPRNLAKSVTVR